MGMTFKSDRSKMESAVVDFLAGAGIKPASIVSYNHLGNSDAMSVSAPTNFPPQRNLKKATM